MKATEQYFPVVLFTTPYKVVLIFERVDKIQRCYHLISLQFDLDNVLEEKYLRNMTETHLLNSVKKVSWAYTISSQSPGSA